MNLFELKIENKGNKFYLENEDLTYEVSNEYFVKYLKGYHEKKLIAGIRPESIKIVLQDLDSISYKS